MRLQTDFFSVTMGKRVMTLSLFKHVRNYCVIAEKTPSEKLTDFVYAVQ